MTPKSYNKNFNEKLKGGKTYYDPDKIQFLDGEDTQFPDVQNTNFDPPIISKRGAKPNN